MTVRPPTIEVPPADRFAVIGETDVDAVSPEAVGVKAYNLMRMASAGLSVPAGFVLGTSVCADYQRAQGRLPDDVDGMLARGVHEIEQTTGLRFGASRRPLLLAVRSGAAASMPGMLDTVLDVGLCDATLHGLLRATGDPVFVWDSYRRLIQSYAEIVDGCASTPYARVVADAMRQLGVPTASELDVEALRSVVRRFQEIYRSSTGRAFDQDPMEQLRRTVQAVLRSWNAERAVQYRRLEGLTDLPGTAVTVQAMVFGNIGVNSGSGVGFTRNPDTGANQLYADFLLSAQGEDVVGGRSVAADAAVLIATVPGLADGLESTRGLLERLFRDAQDFEFTVEEGRLWLLQTRAAKRTPWAALQIACDLVDEGLIDETSALRRLAPYDLGAIHRARLPDSTVVAPVARGTPASTGLTSGRIALSARAAKAYADRGDTVVLVRHEASTDDIAALSVCRGLLTAVGARTSHAALVARERGIVCVVGCSDLTLDVPSSRLRIGDATLEEGSSVTLDGGTGQVYAGVIDLADERPEELIDRVRAWQENTSAA
ncbi:MAG TPA: PEP/pyruvate-binding domain-containing protein [Acidimicrobiia bacterium]|nr:PEP/pyruvate-binding domain-containing protein [Acidimicrobiia bacterium]